MVRDAILTIDHLTVTFSRWSQIVTAVEDFSITVAPGEWVLLTGPNGVGKSTVLRTISGVAPYSVGSVCINGNEVARMSRQSLAQAVFHVHQNPLAGTAPGLTIEENLRLATNEVVADGTHMPSGYLSSMLKPLGLQERVKQPVERLSGGERQLIALLIARLRRSPLLLLDEPFAALDPEKAIAGLAEVQRLHKEGRTIVQVTHDMAQVGRHNGRVITMGAARKSYAPSLSTGASA